MSIISEAVSVELMRRADVPDISAIERACYAVPWHENAYYTELSNRCARYLVARCQGKVVGYGGMWVIMDEAHITTLAVSPAYRGRHIGERLLIHLLDEAMLEGASRATLEVRENNHVAQNLYRKYGFREAAIRKNYYTDNQENALVMWVDDLRSLEYRQRLNELRQQLESRDHDRTGPRNQL